MPHESDGSCQMAFGSRKMFCFKQATATVHLHAHSLPRDSGGLVQVSFP